MAHILYWHRYIFGSVSCKLIIGCFTFIYMVLCFMLSGGMTVLMIIAFHFLNKYRCTNEDDTRDSQVGFDSSARDPLLTNKDDDISSWGSSYDSASNDEEDIQEFLATYSIEGKPYKEVDHEGNNTRRLCAICYDAPRDCFFLPCGHCVACFDCSTR